jgi:predicted AlkP superfamily phosphohydrolase/phosphomutase
MKPRTILIGLDGATFTILDPYMASGVMPFLRDFVAGGVRATLRSVMPPITPPAWTSLMTGKPPGQHGVFDFFQKEEPESVYFRLSGSEDIKSDTIWTLASEHAQRVTTLNFPLMFPPPRVNGSVVPGGWMPWRQLRLGCYPPDLFDRLKALPSFNARELALDMTSEEKATEGAPPEEYADWIGLHTRREQRWFDVLRYLMREEPSDFVGILFDGIDRLQHLCWRFIDPACRPAEPTAWEREIIALCEAYFRQVDDFIAELVTDAGPDTTVVMASDHGFGPTSDVFYLNSWLQQQGYLKWAHAENSRTDETPRVGFRDITRHVYQLDWDRTIAYAATPSSHGIHIVTRKPGSSVSMPAAEYERVRSELVDALCQARHPLTDRLMFTDVSTREEVFAGPHQSLGPDIALRAEDGAVVSILPSSSLVAHRPEPVGTHRPEGVFLASGPGIRRGAVLKDISIIDVAPLLLYSLNVPIPDDVVGQLPADAFEPGVLDERQPRKGGARAPGAVPELATVPVDYDADSEAVIMKRLRALGYVE